jgi:hypothetical protein
VGIVIETPLLVEGSGAAVLVAAKVAAGLGLAGLVVGHEASSDETPVPLSGEAVATLTGAGLFDVLRPYLTGADPPAIAPAAFEEVLKHHCVVDLTITVYDGMRYEVGERRGRGERGAISDGRSRWEVVADDVIRSERLPVELNAAIVAGAAAARAAVAALAGLDREHP